MYLGFGLNMRNLVDVRTHMKRPRCLHTAEVAGSIPASPTLSVFYLQNEQQESNLEDLPLFRRKLTLLDDILADLRNGLRV